MATPPIFPHLNGVWEAVHKAGQFDVFHSASSCGAQKTETNLQGSVLLLSVELHPKDGMQDGYTDCRHQRLGACCVDQHPKSFSRTEKTPLKGCMDHTCPSGAPFPNLQAGLIRAATFISLPFC